MGDLSDIPDWQRYLILAGSGMLSSKHGIQQILNSLGAKADALGTTDKDIETLRFNKEAVQRLSDDTKGGWAAELAGNIADPIGILSGMGGAAAVAKTALPAVAKLAVPAAISGALSETSGDESRLQNAALSGVLPVGMKGGKEVGNKMWAGIKQYDRLPEVQKKVFDLAENMFETTGRWTDENLTRIGQKVGMFPGYMEYSKPSVNPWRAWIDISDAKIPTKDVEGTFHGVLGSKNLARIAPELDAHKTKVTFDPSEPYGGNFSPDTGIALNTPDREHAKYLLAHEGGHGMQELNDWPTGSSPEWWMARLDKVKNSEHSRRNLGAYGYLMDAGEIEARDIEGRLAAGATDSPMLSVFEPYSLNLEHPHGGLRKYFEMASPHGALAGRFPAGEARNRLADLNNPNLIHKFPMFSGDHDRFRGFPEGDFAKLRKTPQGAPATSGIDLEYGLEKKGGWSNTPMFTSRKLPNGLREELKLETGPDGIIRWVPTGKYF